MALTCWQANSSAHFRQTLGSFEMAEIWGIAKATTAAPRRLAASISFSSTQTHGLKRIVLKNFWLLWNQRRRTQRVLWCSIMTMRVFKETAHPVTIYLV